LTAKYGSLKKSLLDQENPSKETPIHWAVLKNNYGIVKRLISEHKIICEQLGRQQQDSDEEEEEEH
jgi:hypothetical protein